MPSPRPLSLATLCAVLLFLPLEARAQELEPGAYWPIPRGMNIITVVNTFNWGDLAFDPSAPIDEASATINSTAFAFTRSIGLLGRSSNVTLILPVVIGHVEGLYFGAPAEVDRFGMADPRFRFAIALMGAPSMTPKEWAAYRHEAILGVSVTVAPPLGEYDSSKLINIGTNRWAFKPEMGFSGALGHWVVEAMAGAWLFTDNTDFLAGGTRQQDPIVSTQLHLTYKFKRSLWLAADANYYTGGRTTVNGTRNFDLQKNSRIGSTFSWALNRNHAIRVSVSRGAVTTIGADFTTIAVGYNYAWL